MVKAPLGFAMFACGGPCHRSVGFLFLMLSVLVAAAGCSGLMMPLRAVIHCEFPLAAGWKTVFLHNSRNDIPVA